MMSSRHWRGRYRSCTLASSIILEAIMKTLWWRFARWFHSFDETDEDIGRLIKTAEDGARLGMVGWY
jgi:hypothetical protein